MYKTLLSLKLLADADDWEFLSKTTLIFSAPLPPCKKRSRATEHHFKIAL